MSKKPRKKGKHDRVASNMEWLNSSLESTPLDLDALASMPIKEVKSDLRTYKTKTNAHFIKELNGKLPEGVSINPPKEAPAKKRQVRKSSPASTPRDRKPVRHAQGSSIRIFSIRNAMILSGLIIAVALLGPYTLKLMNESDPEVAKVPVTQPDSTQEDNSPPTRLEVTFPDIRVRGVTYTLENFSGLVPQFSPLPNNPDTLDQTFAFVATIDSAGNVVGLQSDQLVDHPFEKVIMDSLLMWRFYGDEEADSTKGTILITYKSN